MSNDNVVGFDPRQAQEDKVKAAMREPDPSDASVLHKHQGIPTAPDLGNGWTPPGERPVLRPGVFGGIDQFKAECEQWGFDPKTEGPSRCDEQFDMTARMLDGIRMGMLASHGASYNAGWWHDKNTGELLDQAYQVPIKLCLIHSEISEAMEGDRKGHMDEKLPHRSNFEVELADAYLRIMDLAGAMGVDLAGAVVEKMAYNARRKDHTKAGRDGENGKSY